MISSRKKVHLESGAACDPDVLASETKTEKLKAQRRLSFKILLLSLLNVDISDLPRMGDGVANSWVAVPSKKKTLTRDSQSLSAPLDRMNVEAVVGPSSHWRNHQTVISVLLFTAYFLVIVVVLRVLRVTYEA